MKPEAVNQDFFYIAEEKFLLSGKTLSELIKSALAKNASFRFQAKGFSMSPFIRDGDILTIAPLPACGIRTGMPVAFAYSPRERLMIHRVVRKRQGVYLVKGDNCFYADSPVLLKDILGFVARIERNGKEVRLGLGRERRIIAFFSKVAVVPLLMRGWYLLPGKIRMRLKAVLER